MGSFSGISWDNIRVMTPVVLVSLVCVFLLSKPIARTSSERGMPAVWASISPRSAWC